MRECVEKQEEEEGRPGLQEMGCLMLTGFFLVEKCIACSHVASESQPLTLDVLLLVQPYRTIKGNFGEAGLTFNSDEEPSFHEIFS